MKYGFEPTAFDDKLEERMKAMCQELPPDKYGMRPYIERDGLYSGIRIRRITHYPKKMIDEIAAKCEAVFKEVEAEAAN